MVEFIIYGILALLAAGTVFLIVRLILAFDGHRLADVLAIQAFLAGFRRDGLLITDDRLGWLNGLMEKSSRNVIPLRQSADKLRHAIEWLHQQLPTIANTAMGVGFVGTVESMVEGAATAVDPAAIIGFGMKTTLYGLLIALPGTVYHGLTSKRLTLLLDQIDDVIDALDDHINPPEVAESNGEAPSPKPNLTRVKELATTPAVVNRTNGDPVFDDKALLELTLAMINGERKNGHPQPSTSAREK